MASVGQRALFRVTVAGIVLLGCLVWLAYGVRVTQAAGQDKAPAAQGGTESAAVAVRRSAPVKGPLPDDQVLLKQTQEDMDRKSAGCKSCHTKSDSATMHMSEALRIGCTDCHGGNAEVKVAENTSPQAAEYLKAKKQAHPQPRIFDNRTGGANPVRAYTNWLKEDPAYIRFVNPGDLRIASMTCGRAGCHTSEVQKVRTSMMAHGAMLWSAALYNNGGFPKESALWRELLDRW